MSLTLGFDIYGTLIDTHGLIGELTPLVGSQAIEFSRVWRDKQLEYSFRRGLMRDYQNFGVCTRDALNYTDEFMQAGLSDEVKTSLLSMYRKLPAFSDVEENLQKISDKGFRLFAFSNGTADAVEGLLEHAGISHFFEGIVSVDSRQSFKPNPDIYQYFLDTTQSEAGKSWLVSSNPFDVIGAINIGMQAAWLKRSSSAVFDPWGVEPTMRIESLRELVELD